VQCGDYFENDWKYHPERLEGLLGLRAKIGCKDNLHKIIVIG
jgi:hypothetical protein